MNWPFSSSVSIGRLLSLGALIDLVDFDAVGRVGKGDLQVFWVGIVGDEGGFVGWVGVSDGCLLVMSLSIRGD
jgi:hypothetical protein